MAFVIVRDDLARATSDAIVLPSDERLSLSGGVSAQVVDALGSTPILQALQRMSGCPTGQAVAVPAREGIDKHLVFAVGPIWQEGAAFEKELLRSAYEQALRRVVELDCSSVALPLISSGAFGFPASVSLGIGMSVIRAFLDQYDMDITLYVYDKAAFGAAQDLMGQVDSYIDDHYVDVRHDDWISGRSCPEPPCSQSMASCAPVPSQGQLPAAGKKKLFALPSFLAGDVRRESVDEVFFESCEALPCALEVAAENASGVFCVQCGAELQPDSRFCSHCGAQVGKQSRSDLQDLLDSLDEPFSITLMHLIDQRGLTDAQVYKRANMSRQLFAKIRGNADYRPTKKTVLALCVALELTLPETKDLLSRAGFSLTHASKFDVIVEYFITSGNYDIFDINEVLFVYDQQLLG